MTPEQVLRRIDGPLFGKQREVLTRIIDCEGYRPDSEDLDLLEGLRNLLDAFADVAMDDYGIECSYGCEEDYE